MSSMRFLNSIVPSLLVAVTLATSAAFGLGKAPQGFCDAALSGLSKTTKLERSAAELQAFKEGVAKHQRRAFKTFKALESFDSEVVPLPGRMQQKYQKAYQSISNLMGNADAFFKGVQELEAEVMTESFKTGVSLDLALERVLARWETAHGFGPVVHLAPEILGGGEWHAMLARGSLFYDEYFVDKNREGAPHGRDTHRIQWNVVMREMEKHPDNYGGVTLASELFKKLGDPDFYMDLDLSDGVEVYIKALKTTQPSLWDRLFDMPAKMDNFTSPEKTRSLHEYWPGLGDWI